MGNENTTDLNIIDFPLYLPGQAVYKGNFHAIQQGMALFESDAVAGGLTEPFSLHICLYFFLLVFFFGFGFGFSIFAFTVLEYAL